MAKGPTRRRTRRHRRACYLGFIGCQRISWIDAGISVGIPGCLASASRRTLARLVEPQWCGGRRLIVDARTNLQ